MHRAHDVWTKITQDIDIWENANADELVCVSVVSVLFVVTRLVYCDCKCGALHIIFPAVVLFHDNGKKWLESSMNILYRISTVVSSGYSVISTSHRFSLEHFSKWWFGVVASTRRVFLFRSTFRTEGKLILFVCLISLSFDSILAIGLMLIHLVRTGTFLAIIPSFGKNFVALSLCF